MKQQSTHIVQQMVKDIIKSFQDQVKLQKLMKYRPQFTQQFPLRMGNQSMNSIYMKNTPLKNKDQLNEEQSPSNIKIDQFCNFLVRSDTSVDQKSIVNHQNIQNLEYSKSRVSKASSLNKRQNQSQQLIRPENYFAKPRFNKNDAIQLPRQKQTQQQLEFQLQLRTMQKRLYYTRKMKKQFQQQDNQRLLALKKRKSQQIPKADYTFGFNGEILQKKDKNTKQLEVSQMKVSQSFNDIPREKKKYSNKEDDDGSQTSEQNFNSIFKKTSLFNNYNKRQTSHLPYIKMTQNARIKQSNRSSHGNFSEKTKLKNFIETNQHNSFKHYNEIAKQKRQRQLQEKYKLQNQQNRYYQDLDKSQMKIEEQSGVRKRHSYLMNRYIKKMKQQYVSQQPIKKSVNFKRANFPQNSNLHKFYKHNFNNDKKHYQIQLSNALDS